MLQFGVAPLQALGCRHAGVGKQLMPVEPEDLQSLAVEIEAVGLEGRLPEADGHREGVGHAVGYDLGHDLVERGRVRRPEAHVAQAREADRRHGLAGRGD